MSWNYEILRWGISSHIETVPLPCNCYNNDNSQKKNNDTDDNEINYDNNDNDDTNTTATGSSHETVAVLLPGFAINGIAKLGNNTATVPWHDLTTNENDNNDHNNNDNDDTNTTATFNYYTLPLL